MRSDGPAPGERAGGPRPAFLFLLGTGRCGSTLVHEVLVRHPEIGFVSNVDDNLRGLRLLGRWNNALYRRVPARFTRKGGLRFAPSEGWRVLDREIAPILSQPFRDLLAEDATPWMADRFRGFFEERARAQGRPVFVHKFTGWPRSGFVHSSLPEARFVNVVRDGRAVVNSWLQMPWWLGYRGPAAWHYGPLSAAYAAEWEASGRSFVTLAGLAWKILMDAFEAARARIPPDRWLDLRYEDFLADPRAHLEQMLRFVGLEWNVAFERAVARTPFRTDRRRAYRDEIGQAQLTLLERSLGDHLARWGYEAGDRLDAPLEGVQAPP